MESFSPYSCFVWLPLLTVLLGNSPKFCAWMLFVDSDVSVDHNLLFQSGADGHLKSLSLGLLQVALLWAWEGVVVLGVHTCPGGIHPGEDLPS